MTVSELRDRLAYNNQDAEVVVNVNEGEVYPVQFIEIDGPERCIIYVGNYPESLVHEVD